MCRKKVKTAWGECNAPHSLSTAPHFIMKCRNFGLGLDGSSTRIWFANICGKNAAVKMSVSQVAKNNIYTFE